MTESIYYSAVPYKKGTDEEAIKFVKAGFKFVRKSARSTVDESSENVSKIKT